MTKKEFKKFVKIREFSTRYSGRLKKHFIKKTGFKMDIHNIINSKL